MTDSREQAIAKYLRRVDPSTQSMRNTNKPSWMRTNHKKRGGKRARRIT